VTQVLISPQVLISYARGDQATAEKLAVALRRRGCEVECTADDSPGAPSDLPADRPLMDRQAKAAGCHIVLWSKASVDKPRLAKRAAKAARRRALISALIDDVKPPFVFPPTRAIPLTDASGEVTDLGLEHVFTSVCRRLNLPARPFMEISGEVSGEASRQESAANGPSLLENFAKDCADDLRPYDAGRALLRLIDALSYSDTMLAPEAVTSDTVKMAQAGLIEQMLKDHRPAPEVQQTLTAVNNEIYRRLTASVIERMAADGWGELPVPLAVIVMGSGGRGENYLFSDQDNGFILGDYPDSEHHWIDGYFRQLAERLCRRLNDSGLPFCNGYCMAVNPLWRKTLGQWVEQVSLWVHKRNFVALRLAGIFLDFKGVWGEQSLAAALRRILTRQAHDNPVFLRQMLRDLAESKVALSFFGDLLAEKDARKDIGKIDVKHAGIVPLVEAVRLVALLEGIEETSTLARIGALRATGKLGPDEADDLTAAFCVITDILLRKEVRDYRANHRFTYALYPEAMTDRDKLVLVEPLRAIRRFRRRLRHQLLEEAV
jgi:hypothetical protein